MFVLLQHIVSEPRCVCVIAAYSIRATLIHRYVTPDYYFSQVFCGAIVQKVEMACLQLSQRGTDSNFFICMFYSQDHKCDFA